MVGLEHLRLFRALALVAGAFILLVQAAGAQALHPAAVLDSYERALAEQNLDTAQSLLADSAVITIVEARTRTLRGRVQIREFMQQATPRALPILTTNRQIDGNTIMWSERTDGQLLPPTDLTVQAQIEGGKILSLVYRPGRLVRATGKPVNGGTSAESAGLALGAIVLFGIGLLSLVTTVSHVNAGSQLRGRLVRDLRHWRPLPVSPQALRAPALTKLGGHEILAAARRS